MLKQLKSLTVIYTFSWLGDREVQTAMQEAPGSIPISSKQYVYHWSFVVVVILPFCQTIINMKFCTYFCNIN